VNTVFTANTSVYAQWAVTTESPTSTVTTTPTSIDSRTPTPTYTPPAPTSTATRLPALCDPRPNVALSVVPTSGDDLSVTVSAQSSGTTNDNTLRSLQFGAASNGLVDAGGVNGSPGNFTETLAPGTVSTTFRVHRVEPGLAVTVPIVAFDLCGAWPTFVGAGPSTPTNTPTPTSLPPTATTTPAPPG
jgi:hypothetical protein